MQFMVIERFRNQDARAIYRHLRDKGRGLPEGLTVLGSWIEPNFDRCFQVMECADARLLQAWVLSWNHLVTFEIVPVVPSAETRAVVEPHLGAANP